MPKPLWISIGKSIKLFRHYHRKLMTPMYVSGVKAQSMLPVAPKKNIWVLSVEYCPTNVWKKSVLFLLFSSPLQDANSLFFLSLVGSPPDGNSTNWPVNEKTRSIRLPIAEKILEKVGQVVFFWHSSHQKSPQLVSLLWSNRWLGLKRRVQNDAVRRNFLPFIATILKKF